MVHRSLPPFYVITVNYHSGEHLPGLIASLAPLHLVRKLIIVNHSPEEGLADLAAPFAVQVIDQGNRGFGAGLNRGLREIPEPGAAALLCNPDIALLTPERVAEALAYLQAHPRVGCLIPGTVDEAGQTLYPVRTFYSWKTLLAARIGLFRRAFSGAYRGHLYLDEPPGLIREADWGSGAAVFYRVAAFGGAPAFDDNFFLYFEDVDFCARLWLSGLAVVYYPDLLVRHQGQRQSRRRWRFLWYHLASLGKFILKYRGLPQRADLVRGNPGISENR